MSESIRARLLGQRFSDEDREWDIYGEDPNCDMGGHHSNPHLTTVKGRYKDVVEFALTLPGFVGWGYGGNIKPHINPNIIVVPKGFTKESLKDLYVKKTKLELELAALEEKIKNLDIDYE